MEFAERIRMLRQKMFLSQDEFAKRINVSLSTVNRWEMGRSKPQPDSHAQHQGILQREQSGL